MSSTDIENMNKALLEAIRKDDLQQTRDLLQAGADVNYAEGPMLISALHVAMENQKINKEVVSELLHKGALVDKQAGGSTPVMLALQNTACPIDDLIKVVELLFNAGARIRDNYIDEDNRSYLHLAVLNRSLELVKLIMKQPNFNSAKLMSAVDRFGTSVLSECVQVKELEIFKYLVSHPANAEQQLAVDTRFRDPLLHAAVQRGYTDFVRYILQLIQDMGDSSKTTFDHKNYPGKTALMIAASSLHIDNINLILQYETNINEVDKTGCNALVNCITSPVFYNEYWAQCITTLVQMNCNIHVVIERLVDPDDVILSENILDVALDTNCVSLCKFVAIAGSPCQRLSLIIDSSTKAHVLEINEWLLDFYSTPRSLQEQCRINIRRLLGKRLRFTLPQLEMPKVLSQYLMLEDLEQYTEAIDAEACLRFPKLL